MATDCGTNVSTAVIIPAGPRDDVADTLDSVLCFIRQPRMIVIVDDTDSPQTLSLGDIHPDVRVIAARTGLPRGPYGGLFVKLTDAYRLVIEHGKWDVVIRMDADALLTGFGLEATGAERFADDHRLGILGAYRTGPHGGTRDWGPICARLRSEIDLRGLRKPALRSALRFLVHQAKLAGYEMGSHAMGTCLISPRLIEAWAALGWLDLSVLSQSRLGDDHLAGLLCAAAGFRLADMSGPDDQMAIQWRSLSYSPETLLQQGKTIVHTVRTFEDLTEEEIREIFRSARSQKCQSEMG